MGDLTYLLFRELAISNVILDLLTPLFFSLQHIMILRLFFSIAHDIEAKGNQRRKARPCPSQRADGRYLCGVHQAPVLVQVSLASPNLRALDPAKGHDGGDVHLPQPGTLSWYLRAEAPSLGPIRCRCLGECQLDCPHVRGAQRGCSTIVIITVKLN